MVGAVGVEVVKVRDEWAAANRALVSAATKDLRSVLRKTLSEATKPTRLKIRESARSTLPHGGGLNEWAAVLPSAVTDFRPNSAQISIRDTKGRHDMKALDEGTARHPVFGNRKAWTDTTFAAGFFTQAILEDRPALDARVRAAMDAFMTNLGRKAI